jgi:hypothetical protein
MRRAALLPLAALALAVPAASVAGCSCDIDCAGPQVDVVINQGVHAVEVCGAPGECTRDTVGEWSPGIGQRSFTMQPPTSASWSVRAFDEQGDVLIEQVLVPKFDDPGGCDCASNVEIVVLPTEIRQTGA